MAAADDTGLAPEDKDEHPDEEQPGAEAEEFLTVYETHALIGLRLRMGGSMPSEWLNSWIEKGAVKKLYQEPITEWVRVSGWGQEPHPQHWRFRKDEIEAASLDDPLHQLRLACTADPGPSMRPWISHALACAMVADASGFDQDRAAVWLAARSRRGGTPLRARFAPQALAAAERKSERERHRKAFFPHLNMIFHGAEADIRRHPGCCLWHPPNEALAAGECPALELILAQVEWHADELRSVLIREFAGYASARPPAPASVIPSPDQDDGDLSPLKKRQGRQPGWPWPGIVAEAEKGIQDFIGPDGKVMREAFIAHL